MFNALYNAVLEWNRNTDDREKLQHAYLVVAIVVLLVAGLVSLLDSEVGQNMLVVSLAAGAIFLVNTVVWSLLDSVVIARLTNRRKK